MGQDIVVVAQSGSQAGAQTIIMIIVGGTIGLAVILGIVGKLREVANAEALFSLAVVFVAVFAVVTLIAAALVPSFGTAVKIGAAAGALVLIFLFLAG